MIRELTFNREHPHSHQLRLFTTNHVPHNKLSWQVNEGRCVLEVTDYDGEGNNPDPWTEVKLREIEADKRGQDRSKVISITLNRAEREALIDLLTRGAAA